MKQSLKILAGALGGIVIFVAFVIREALRGLDTPGRTCLAEA